ncbi:NAD(P)-dependent dehydrogenase (short-subunit alcohol dehydrogenase family) [Pedobacter cryoconitis]|uniref:NAD(P)-dependent dehydrogenase (Short-subunit alcohol dehydrogenase family) n=1 Tax=Pedobacter cryoconitis TaxID=188932 RepID=A0A7W8ZNI0_9SPHI|nr:SDR family oxidoreductase [Pedobacter cryoconitis]MBB5637304.1 NAD(P)-dependent dehydrogenase (short-subunit alcohol dehydrogenase family) [Pedobacter cryoconitis]
MGTVNKVWYITGASKGMGLSLVQNLLNQGHQVVATSRKLTVLKNAVDPVFDSFFLPVEVDLGDEDSIARSFKLAIEKFGRIDVVVNNAGYGTGGALEELSGKEIGENFDVNFFAVIRVIQKALPYLRAQQSGHIMNISSIAGFAPGTGWSVYAAAKFAVSGLSEALANDLKPLGIQVTAVSPGWFRTSFATAESIVFSENQLQEYDYIREFHAKFNAMNGNQLGNPEKVADVLIQLAESENPPVNFFMGSDACQRAENKIKILSEEMESWKSLSGITDFGG